MSETAENAKKVFTKAGPLQMSAPIIPDSIVAHICSSVGLVTDDVRIIRTVALATQVFMANVTNDAMNHYKARLRSSTSKSGQSGQHGKDSKALTMEDLSPVLQDHGITCKKPPSFV